MLQTYIAAFHLRELSPRNAWHGNFLLVPLMTNIDTTDTFAVQRMVTAFSSSLSTNKTNDGIHAREALIDALATSAVQTIASALHSPSENMSEADKTSYKEMVSGFVTSMATVTSATDQMSPQATNEGISLLANLSEIAELAKPSKKAEVTKCLWALTQ